MPDSGSPSPFSVSWLRDHIFSGVIMTLLTGIVLACLPDLDTYRSPLLVGLGSIVLVAGTAYWSAGRTRSKWIPVGVGFLLLVATGWAYYGAYYSDAGQYEVVDLVTKPIHLGDKRLDFFDQPAPMGVDTVLTFTLNASPTAAKLRIRAHNVDPDKTTGAFAVVINQGWQTYINDHPPFVDTRPADEHKFGYRTAHIDVNPGALRRGQNKVLIGVIGTRSRGFDDVEFDLLQILYR